MCGFVINSKKLDKYVVYKDLSALPHRNLYFNLALLIKMMGLAIDSTYMQDDIAKSYRPL